MTTTTTESTAADFGTLTDYITGEAIRPATEEERDASVEAAERDGGSGVIAVDERPCFVSE